MKNDLPEYINELLSPKQYPHLVNTVELRQTHSSYVLLAGDFVYKFKKEVDFGFLDFSSLKKRHYYCHRELTLNRRLCPDIYLDVVSVNQADNHFALNGLGEIVDYGVLMKRLPEEGMLIRLAKENKLTAQHISYIVQTLIPFYQKANQNAEINEYGKVDAISKNIYENFEQIRPFVGKGCVTEKQFSQIKAFSQKVLADSNVFTSRINDGFIHDCHGDLHLANICIADKVYIYDCIEFNNRLRYTDIVADIAFLAMDLDFHGLEDFAKLLVAKYGSSYGDETLSSVFSFYKCYRAVVRGKVGLLTAADPAVGKSVRDDCWGDAKQYFKLAERYAEE